MVHVIGTEVHLELNESAFRELSRKAEWYRGPSPRQSINRDRNTVVDCQARFFYFANDKNTKKAS